jgi:CheY-like chemotaxis protein/two-component sensor histidine kinase
VGQLAAGTAHEINNPLSIVYARAQIMEQKEDDPAKKKNLGQMLSQLDRISNILQHLMDFARPAPPVMEDLSLNDLVRDALELMRDGLEDNGIEVRTDLDDSLPPVRGDQDQLQSLLVNLLLNGQQAMLEEGVENPSLALSTHLDDSGDKAVLRVRDTGPGIPTDVVDRVFEPFFTTKEQGSGTGLGLSICYGIVQSHNGVIRLQNAAGGGAEAVVWLPLAPAAAPAESREPRRADVLVVDDEDYIRELLRETLNSAGFGVETAVDGQEARDRLLSKRYRLVLLDLRMPRREGMEVLRDIRAGGVNTPVIVLTGAASDEEVRMAKGLGAVSAVRKPFKVDELLALARRTMAPAEKQ